MVRDIKLNTDHHLQLLERRLSLIQLDGTRDLIPIELVFAKRHAQ